jgi:TnpA family transposase
LIRLKTYTFSDSIFIRYEAGKNKDLLLTVDLPLFGHYVWKAIPMASIERTAYPRFKSALTAHERQELYSPTDDELAFVWERDDDPAQQLLLLARLKCHQFLGYLPTLDEIPDSVRLYLCQQLQLPPETSWDSETKAGRRRHRQAIRMYLKVTSYSHGGERAVTHEIEQAAYTMSDPADLINVAIERLIEQRFELPAFSTLDRLVGRVRHHVHQHLYDQITGGLTPDDIGRLEALLGVYNGRTEFSRIKAVPRGASLQHMRQWANRLDWLESILTTPSLVAGVASTKIQQFAAEAQALDALDMRRIQTIPRRRALLVCMVHQAQVQTRDQLAEMFLKRMRRTLALAKEKLKELQDQHREREEHMLAVFADIIDETIQTPEDNAALGQGVRDILKNEGGAEALRARYEQVSAYHNQNYRPLMWFMYRPYRAAIFRLSRLLTFRLATQNQSLINALAYMQSYQNTRRDYLPYAISLDFASVRWQALVTSRQKMETVLDRRQLEVCIFHYLAQGLQSGDVYVEGSQEHADYRQQLLPWSECVRRLPAYCQVLQMPETAESFVAHLQQRLREVCDQVDRTFPANTELTIDEEGKPHLKRLKAQPTPEELEALEALLKERMPERHLLDILKNVQHWVGYTRHFGPPSGADPKLADPIARYILTVFGYACELGASQTARHAQNLISRQSLRRINAQHITATKLEAGLRDVINAYIRFELPFLWGSGQAAIADGTHIALLENNLLGARHVRYGGFGGIAYHHISDTYIALFSHFIACGVWEAVYILDGLLKNKSALQPDTLHADTHGQSEPVFGLAALLGIKLMPRMRTWNDVTFYRVDRSTTYQHIDRVLTQVVDWELIERHWQDMMQVVLSIQAGTILPSMLMQKLGVYSRKNSLYRAFSELGRVERTIFLLYYLSDPAMRQQIRAETTKVESYNNFTDWLAFGGPVLRSGDPVEQEKRIKYRDLVANAVMLQNVVDMTNVLHGLKRDGVCVTPELVARLSPYLTEHIKRFGQYIVDMDVPPEPLNIKELFSVWA